MQEKDDDRGIAKLLRTAYGAIKPPDSWEALRARIDRKLEEADSSKTEASEQSSS
jgi:hypothetical protein